jgi:anti-sigma regulatory factor (Ser/Thr protein kinase)
VSDVTDQSHVAANDEPGSRTNDFGSSAVWLRPHDQVASRSGGTGAVHADGRSEVRRAAQNSAPAPVLPPEAWLNSSVLELAALPTAVACGRLHIKQLLWEWKLDTIADDAETLVSELLTNAVRASRSPRDASFIALRLLANRRQLIIEVWDQNPHDPQPHRADFDAEHGRGSWSSTR